jgi:hypothetical protein
VEYDFKGSSIGGNDDEFSDASIKCLGGLIGSLLDLLKRCALGKKIEDLGGEFFSSKGLGSFWDGLNDSIITILLKEY